MKPRTWRIIFAYATALLVGFAAYGIIWWGWRTVLLTAGVAVAAAVAGISAAVLLAIREEARDGVADIEAHLADKATGRLTDGGES